MGVPKMTRRFEVWDDLGKLRTFYTKAEAERFLIDGMFIITHKPLTRSEHYENMLREVEECLL